ncbi:MAG: AAA family ATPase [Rhodobacteraceae bacterium]|nr:AAA family ATPase [Paracoccaceae bacterium]
MTREVPVSDRAAGAARLHITGAACAGVTTLGGALAARLGVPLVDTDEAYWLPTDPPYTTRRLPQERRALIRDWIHDSAGWVIAGSLVSWGTELIRDAHLTVFVDTPTPLRLERLRAREAARFGARIQPGGDMHAIHESFLDWAACYDDPAFDGRSRRGHEDWLSRLPMPVLAVAGTEAVDALVERVVAALDMAALDVGD